MTRLRYGVSWNGQEAFRGQSNSRSQLTTRAACYRCAEALAKVALRRSVAMRLGGASGRA